MSKFKPGDEIVCINDMPHVYSVQELALDQTYTVKDTKTDSVALEGFTERLFFNDNRFVLCSCGESDVYDGTAECEGHPVPLERDKRITTRPIPVEAALMESPAVLAMQAKIERLERDVNVQGESILTRNHLITQLSTQVNDLQHESSQRKATSDRLSRELGVSQDAFDGLLTTLREYADTRESEGDDDGANEIDQILANFNAPPRKKHFEIIFTVPVTMRVEGDWKDENEARLAFEAGTVEWNVADNEGLADGEADPRIIAIEEIDQ